MDHQQVRDIVEAAFKARFGDIDILSINIKPGFDHDDDPLLEVNLIYDGKVEQLIAPDKAPYMMDVRTEIIDKVWREAEDPIWPQVHFISKSDIGRQDPATV